MKGRRYLTFSLRTLFVVTTAFAVSCGFIVNRAREQREAVKAIEALGGVAYYDWLYEPQGEPGGPAWLRRLIGDDFFQQVQMVSFDGVPPDENGDVPGSIPYLRRLRGLETIIVPAKTSRATLNKLKEALPNCEVYWPEV